MTSETFIFELLAPTAGIVALLVAFFLARYINKFPIGNEKMKSIYDAIRECSIAYLKQQYKTIGIISIILTIVIYLVFDLRAHENPGVPTASFAFVIGASFSLLAGYVGMDVATKANARTA